MLASLVARLRRRPLSPAGSPYCSENSCKALVLVTRRTAAGMKVDSSHSDGNTPMPGCGLSLGRWNMPRIRVLASAATGWAAGGWPTGPRLDSAGPPSAATESRT